VKKKVAIRSTLTKIDWKQIKRLATIQCTHEEMAAYMDISPVTLYKRCLEDNGVELKELLIPYKTKGKVSLRRKLHRMALGRNNFPALKFALGNYLKMYDKEVLEIGNKDFAELTDEERETFQRLAVLRAKEEIKRLE
jgi:hypothetical protein